MLSRVSHVQLFATPWTVAHQALLSMGFSRQEYWSGLPCPPPGDLPNPGIEPVSPMSPACRQILYHWATREALNSLTDAFFFNIYIFFCYTGSLLLRMVFLWLWRARTPLECDVQASHCNSFSCRMQAPWFVDFSRPTYGLSSWRLSGSRARAL